MIPSLRLSFADVCTYVLNLVLFGFTMTIIVPWAAPTVAADRIDSEVGAFQYGGGFCFTPIRFMHSRLNSVTHPPFSIRSLLSLFLFFKFFFFVSIFPKMIVAMDVET